jgi:hypothetical protein
MPAGGSKAKRPPGPPKKSAARQRAAQAVSVTDALAEAAWAEADAALAQALADFDEAETASHKAARADAIERLGQALARAGRKRGLTRVGALGETAAFDARQHELNAAVAQAPKAVLIQARGVMRGGELLEKARVVPVEAKKKRP